MENKDPIVQKPKSFFELLIVAAISAIGIFITTFVAQLVNSITATMVQRVQASAA